MSHLFSPIECYFYVTIKIKIKSLISLLSFPYSKSSCFPSTSHFLSNAGSIFFNFCYYIHIYIHIHKNVKTIWWVHLWLAVYALFLSHQLLLDYQLGGSSLRKIYFSTLCSIYVSIVLHLEICFHKISAFQISATTDDIFVQVFFKQPYCFPVLWYLFDNQYKKTHIPFPPPLTGCYVIVWFCSFEGPITHLPYKSHVEAYS